MPGEVSGAERIIKQRMEAIEAAYARGEEPC
jgi:hypothetical protein